MPPTVSAATASATSATSAPLTAIETSASTLPKQRLVSLDAYRGLTMFAMASGGIGLRQVAAAFSDSPLWRVIFYQTEHVPWVGCSVWDMIQPSFMFIVGVAMIFSCTSRVARGESWGRMALHAAWRSLVLILLGIFLRSENRPQTNFMFEDVLTQIGLGYFFLFLLWNKKPAVLWGVALALLVGDWLMFYAYPVPPEDFNYASMNVPDNYQHLTGLSAHWDMNTNAANAFDQWWMNLFPRETPYIASPGGYQSLNFIPSLATMIFGLLAGRLLQSAVGAWRKVGWLIAAGVAGIAVGWALDHWGICPIVKRIWTPSWALFSSGIVSITLASFFAVVDVIGLRRWTFPFVVVGMNSILIYVMAELLPPWFMRRMQTHLGEGFATLWGMVPDVYSPLVRGVWLLTIMWLICYWCYRQKVFIRI